MVYCGKPSPGCSNCRERKIKCDGGKPRCGQCIKRQQACPGYRNLVDLMFRDESSHVIKKAKARARKKGIVLVDSSDSSPEVEPRNISATPEPLPLREASTSTGRPSGGRHLSLITPINYSQNRSPSAVSGASSSPPAFSAPAKTDQIIKWEPPISDDDNFLPSPDDGSWPSAPRIALVYKLDPTFQERGIAYFFSRYMTLEETTGHQHFNFIYDVWKPRTQTRTKRPPSADKEEQQNPKRQEVDVVLACITAVGLLGLANMVRSSELMDAAQKSYGTALLLTNQALESPVDSLKDTTMLSVLILGLFEMQKTERNFVSRSGASAATSVRAFHDHVKGATALAKERGIAQFGNRAGVRMFSILCQRVFISCLQQDLTMPEELIDLQQELIQLNTGTNFECAIRTPSMQLFGTVRDLLQVRCDMLNDNLNDPEKVVDRLLTLERELAQVVIDVPTSWHYRTFQVSNTLLPTSPDSQARHRHAAIFNGMFHIYSSAWYATQWNYIRTLRVLVLETVLNEIRRDLQSLYPRLATKRHTDDFADTRRLLERLLNAITASVPQNLGLVGPRVAPTPDDDIQSMINADELTLASTPMSSIEIRETPSLYHSSSPENTKSPAKSSSFTAGDMLMNDDDEENLKTFREPKQLHLPPSPAHPRDDQLGPTLLNPTCARSTEDKVRRFMLLASSLHPIVWPLYVVGMSSVASDTLNIYTAERLRAVATELSVEQAGEVAALVEEQRHRYSELGANPARKNFPLGARVNEETPMGGRTESYWERVPV